MQEILTTFGIDWRLLIVNAINFALMLLVLWYFLYTPLMRILENRRQKVAQGVMDAETARVTLKEIEGSRGVLLAEAGKEADTILSLARSAAAAKERELVVAAEGTAQRIMTDAEVQAKELKAQTIAEAEKEVAKMIVLGMEKMV